MGFVMKDGTKDILNSRWLIISAKVEEETQSYEKS